MNISGKIWGTTSLIFSNNNVEVHRITGKAGGVSSTHKHEAKSSLFFVESGKIEILIEKNDYNLTDSTILTTGQSTMIKSGEFHSFRILEDAICYEIYWVTLDPNDIIRKDCGRMVTEGGVINNYEDTHTI